MFAVGMLTLPLRLCALDAAETPELGDNAAQRKDEQNRNLQSAAGVFVDSLSRREFQQASANFDETMKRGLPPQKLEQVWENLITEVGLLKEQGDVRIQQAGEYRVVDISCAFEHGARVVRVSFNREGQIAGVFFLPPHGGGANKVNPALIASYIIALFVEITAPFLLAVFLWRRMRGRWRFWLVGLLVFLLFQVVTRIPLVLALQSYSPLQKLLQPRSTRLLEGHGVRVSQYLELMGQLWPESDRGDSSRPSALRGVPSNVSRIARITSTLR